MSPRPKYFYVVGNLSTFGEPLARGYFEGLTGVSDTPTIFNDFLWLRGAGLAMPTNELLEINDSPLVCQLNYDDPDALAADNLKAYGRLYNSEGNIQSTVSKFGSRLVDALKAQSEMGWGASGQSKKQADAGRLAHSLSYNGIASYEIQACVEDGECVIDSARDFASYLWHDWFLSHYRRSKGALGILQERNSAENYSFDDFLYAVKRALVVGGAYYSDEGEWLVQQPRMNIPESTILVLTDGAGDHAPIWWYQREQEYEQGWRVKRNAFYKSVGIEADTPYTKLEAVEKMGLEEMYDTRWVETETIKRKNLRRSQLGRLDKRLMDAKTRVINPSLDAEFWGEQGAGAYLVAEDTGRVLLTLRSAQVNEPGTWGIPGGAIDADESPAAAARREIEEELGYDGDIEFDLLPAFSKGSFVYHNHIAQVSEEFEPVLDWENDDYGWFYLEDLEELDLHPGVRWMLEQGGLGG